MKLVIVAALALVAAVAAAPQAGKPEYEAKILRSDFDVQPNGAYQYSFESDDGTSRVENGEVKSVVGEDNKPQDVVVARGSYAYKDNEGKSHSINYFADEFGYHAEGEDIPKPNSR